MDPRDALFENVLKPVAIATANLVGSQPAATLLNLSMKQYGLRILEHLSEGDKSGIFVAVEFAEAGKDLDGGILTLQDRAIFAWSTGTFRIKTFDAVVPYASITSVEEAIRPRTRTCVALSTVRVSAARDWTIVLTPRPWAAPPACRRSSQAFSEATLPSSSRWCSGVVRNAELRWR